MTSTRTRRTEGKIAPGDVANRYGRSRTDTPDAAAPGRTRTAPSGTTRTRTGAAPDASTRTGRSDSNAARIEALRRQTASRSANARTKAAREKLGREGMEKRVTSARREVERQANRMRADKARNQYNERMNAARRKAGLSDPTTIGRRPGNPGPGDLAGGRPTTIGSRRDGSRPLGPTQIGRPGTANSAFFGGGFNNGFNYGASYYNNCFWNTWSPYYSNAWCGLFFSPFYSTGLWWNNYWANGYSWRSGFRYRPWKSTFANFYWYGPFLPAARSVVVYEDPNPSPEVVYIEVPQEEEEVNAGQVVVVPNTDASEGLPPEATDPGLQRELNRAAAYYLTQGDRAFREGRFGDSAHFYAKSVEFSPESGILYLVLSDALFATGDYRYAAYALRQAFAKEPELATNMVDKREFYADPAQFDQQLSILERFVEDHVLDMDARLVLAANYLFSGNPAGTTALLEGPFGEELVATDEGVLLRATAREIQEGSEN